MGLLFGGLTALGSALAHPVLSFVLLVALLIGFAALFARRELWDFVFGGLRAIASLAYSPFYFMRKAVKSLAAFRATKEEDEARSDTYLINRALTILLVVVVLVGLLVLAGGLADAIGSLVPEKYLREQIAQVSKELKAAQAEFDQAQANLQGEQKRWERDRAAIVQDFRNNRGRERDQVMADFRKLAVELEGYDTLVAIDRELGPVSGQLGPGEIDQRQKRAQRVVQGRSWWDTRPRDRLLKYITLWRNASLADHEANALSEEEIGSRLLAPFQQRVEQTRGPVGETQREHKALWAQVWAPFAAFPVKVLLTVLGFLAFVWFVGTLFEWIGLFVRLADNVRAMKEQSEAAAR